MANQRPSTDLKTRFLTSKAVLAGTFVVLVLLSISLGKEVYRSYQINQEISSVRADIAQLQQKNAELAHVIDYFKTDSYQEKEARQKLNLQKPGETAVAIPPAKANETDQDKIASAQAKVDHPDDNSSNAEKWWNYFFSSEHN